MTRAQVKERAELVSEMRARLARRGVTPDTDFSAFEVGMVRPEHVGLTGNVHLPLGRIAKRIQVDKWFAKLKF